jgi:hypothetical protein
METAGSPLRLCTLLPQPEGRMRSESLSHGALSQGYPQNPGPTTQIMLPSINQSHRPILNT